MTITPVSLAILSAYGLANPPRPLWLGSRATLSTYMRSGGPVRHIGKR